VPWKKPNAHWVDPLVHSALDANEQHVSAHTWSGLVPMQRPERHWAPEVHVAPPIALLAGVERPSHAGSTQ